MVQKSDACFVLIRLISDVQIKIEMKPNKYKVDEHLGHKFKKVMPNTAKVIS